MQHNRRRSAGRTPGVVAILMLALGAIGCSEKGVAGTVCDPMDPEACPSGFVCLPFGAEHMCFDRVEGACDNGVLEPGEQCDGGDFGGATCADFGLGSGVAQCSTACSVVCPLCGNGVVDPGEECDDGNDDNTDECVSGPNGGCRLPVCGDGFVWAGHEECDDGNNNVNDDCPDGPDGTCQPARCGDGYLWTQGAGAEDCDCGTDASSPSYNQPWCLGSNSDTDAGACRATMDGGCYWSVCGDGVVDTGEECDNGSANSDTAPNACRADCHGAHCGDGVVDTGEVCDDGNTVDGDGCSQDCISAEICGNGIVDGGEGCDDGNQDNSDGCPDGVGGTCHPARCGDGHVWSTGGGTEGCDDGNVTNHDDCPDDAANGGLCQPATCGDGFVWSGHETCDDGNTVGGDGCNATCTGAGSCGDGVLDANEVCDGTDFGLLDCTTFGYASGSLGCTGSCTQIDLSGCVP